MDKRFVLQKFLRFVSFVVKLAYKDLGGTGKSPLVILHGLLGSSRNWQTAGRDLAEHFHVLAVDLRNHGVSPHADSHTYPVMVEDVTAFLEEQGIGQTVVIGHSMGGKVAMKLACEFPSRVKSLVVVDIAPKDYLSRAHRAEFAAMNELNLSALKSRAEAELRMEGRVNDWAMRKFLTTNLDRSEAGGWRWTVNLPVLTNALPVLEKNPLQKNDHFDGPTLIIAGEKSRYILPEDESTALEHFPSAKFVTIPAAGHNPHMETREAFVRVVEDFLNQSRTLSTDNTDTHG